MPFIRKQKLSLGHLLIDPTAWALLISNIIVIFFALVEGWSLALVMLAYVSQSIIIGFFSLLKILSLKEFTTEGFSINGRRPNETGGTKIYTALFFAVHYGIFHLVYLVFVLGMIFSKPLGATEVLSVIAAAVIFFANHLFSFLANRERDSAKKPNIGRVMFFPYARIIPMHLTLVFGFFLQSGAFPIIFFLGLKTLADLIMHAIEHADESLKMG